MKMTGVARVFLSNFRCSYTLKITHAALRSFPTKLERKKKYSCIIIIIIIIISAI